MEPESLVQLVGSGNTSIIEEEWVKLLDSPDVTPVNMVGYDAVLLALRKRERVDQAESLAWTAIEALVDRYSPRESLPMAGSFLLAIGDSPTLRGQVTNLYRSAFVDVEGLEALLTEAGIAEGRPVRRALRTLDVCLAIDEGDYLVARHEDGAARVESIVRSDWSFTINLGRETEELGAVYLADSYRPAPPDDFRVMRCFAREELSAKLQKEPASVVIEMCRMRDNKIDSLELERMLVPAVIPGADWKKWWTKARSALKKCRNVAVEGRSPHYLTYREEAESPEEAFLDDLKRINDPLKELARVERCISECQDAGTPLDENVARAAYDFLESRAKRVGKSAVAEAGLRWAVAARVRTLLDSEGAPEGAASWLADPKRFAASFDLLETEALISVMFDCAVAAHGGDWQEQFLSTLPNLTLPGCDFISMKLVDAGLGKADFEPVVEAILASPLNHFEALLWLWNGPTQSEIVEVPPLRTLINKILHTFEQSLRMENVDPKRMRKVGSRARTVLAARRHERCE